LFPEEEAAVARAVDKRRREYTTVRHCARRALAELGHGPVPIVNGPNREPLWPDGVIGSLTHCDGYRAAAVAPAGALRSLGIDAEPHAPLPGEVLGTVAGADERAHLAKLAELHPEVHWDRLLFSAKESVYKTWFPLARVWLGFEEAVLEFDPAGTFEARILKPGPLAEVSGRWTLSRGLVVTSIAL
jgi:4'-phosphopantetheinyl transferase EntD